MQRRKVLSGRSMGCLAAMMIAAGSGNALAVSFGDGTSSVNFDIVSGQLVVTLSNDSATAAVHPTDVLTAVFFSGADGLTPVSALTPSSGTVLWDASSSSAFNSQNVGGEWAYGSGLSGTPGGATAGISSTGVNLFGNGNFNGPDLWAPASVDGLQGGLVSSAYAGAGQGGDMTKNQLVSHEVIFTLDGFNGNLGDISDVSFLYGTSLGGTSVPDGGTTVLMLGGVLSVLSMWVRFFKK